MEILKSPSGQTRALRKMDAYGVLGAYLPAFGRVVGQMQHDLFHAYTVDAHLLFVLRNLRRMDLPRHDHELPDCSRLMQGLFKKYRLYLADSSMTSPRPRRRSLYTGRARRIAVLPRP